MWGCTQSPAWKQTHPLLLDPAYIKGGRGKGRQGREREGEKVGEGEGGGKGGRREEGWRREKRQGRTEWWGIYRILLRSINIFDGFDILSLNVMEKWGEDTPCLSQLITAHKHNTRLHL